MKDWIYDLYVKELVQKRIKTPVKDKNLIFINKQKETKNAIEKRQQWPKC